MWDPLRLSLTLALLVVDLGSLLAISHLASIITLHAPRYLADFLIILNSLALVVAGLHCLLAISCWLVLLLLTLQVSQTLIIMLSNLCSHCYGEATVVFSVFSVSVGWPGVSFLKLR